MKLNYFEFLVSESNDINFDPDTGAHKAFFPSLVPLFRVRMALMRWLPMYQLRSLDLKISFVISALETMMLREELGDHLFFTFFMIATVVALLAFSIGPMSCKWPQPRVLVESFGLSWTGRSVTSDEASKWLGELLKLCSSEEDVFTWSQSHDSCGCE